MPVSEDKGTMEDFRQINLCRKKTETEYAGAYVGQYSDSDTWTYNDHYKPDQ